MMTSYKRIKGVETTFRILKFLSEQKVAISGKEIASALNIPHGTVMCYLATLEDGNYINNVADKYEIGQGIAYIWARSQANLKGKINRLTDIMQKLEG